jgi:hypothetical protein
MRRSKLVLCGVVAALVGGGSASSALASPAATPPPTAGSASCNGLIVAFENQDSGPFGASGNPNSSAGPGYFLGPASPEAIVGVREEFCG